MIDLSKDGSMRRIQLLISLLREGSFLRHFTSSLEKWNFISLEAKVKSKPTESGTARRIAFWNSVGLIVKKGHWQTFYDTGASLKVSRLHQTKNTNSQPANNLVNSSTR